MMATDKAARPLAQKAEQMGVLPSIGGTTDGAGPPAISRRGRPYRWDDGDGARARQCEEGATAPLGLRAGMMPALRLPSFPMESSAKTAVPFCRRPGHRAGAYSSLNRPQYLLMSKWVPAPPAAVRDDERRGTFLQRSPMVEVSGAPAAIGP
jgi:hypothetical protein